MLLASLGQAPQTPLNFYFLLTLYCSFNTFLLWRSLVHASMEKKIHSNDIIHYLIYYLSQLFMHIKLKC